MQPDYEELTEAARRIASALHISVSEVVLNNRRGRAVLVLPVGAPEAAEAPGRNVPLEILKALRDAGRPLTGLAVHEQLERRGVGVGKSTLDRLLAKMVSDGDLANPPGAKPPGYRLPAEGAPA